MNTKIKTKYTEIGFHQEHDGNKKFYWASVGLAWTEKAGATALAFATLMDGRLLDEARRILHDAVPDEKSIYLEDWDLLVHPKTENRHLTAKLIGLVERLEAEFDELIRDGRETSK